MKGCARFAVDGGIAPPILPLSGMGVARQGEGTLWRNVLVF